MIVEVKGPLKWKGATLHLAPGLYGSALLDYLASLARGK